MQAIASYARSCVLIPTFAIALGVSWAAGEDLCFFQVRGGTNLVIEAIDRNGVVTWSSDGAATCTVEVAHNLSQSDPWRPFAVVLTTGAVTSAKLFDLAPPAGMVLIPAGLFTMGAVIDDGETNEEPVHVVAVSGFYMDTTEVTKTKWDEVHTWATNHGYSFWCDIVGAAHGTGAQAEGPDHPVYLVDWYDCVKWANARSEMEGLTPCYSLDGVVYRTDSFDHLFDIYDPACDWNANGYRLPTEAEWEKAGRGGAENSRFPWGDTNTIQHARANYTSSALYTYDTSPTRGAHPDYDDPAKALNTSPVGAFAPNGYGLYDMAGNVEEWCWDWYAPGYYGVSPQSDPRGAALAEVEFGPGYGCRITRGGACVGRGGIDCRVAARFWTGPGTAVSIGFRLVRRVP